jgi:hypothetical protein
MLYMLDSLYQRSIIIEDYDSLIWTERFSDIGDFELKIAATYDSRRKFKPEKTLLQRDGSYRMMVVEKVEEKTEDDGRTNLKITGRSFERVLDDRVVLSALSNSTDTESWHIGSSPGAIIDFLFIEICQNGMLDAGDIIQYIDCGNSIYPPDTIPEEENTVWFSIEPKSLYTVIKGICDQFSMGFRISLQYNSNPPYLEFNHYTGRDLTTAQTENTPVVFNASLENLQNPTALKTSDKYKTVAYVLSPVGSAIVTLTFEGYSASNVERRVLLVIAKDITDSNPTVAMEQMSQRGAEELAKYARLSMVDGEVDQYTTYVYGQDYHLGDFVEVQNSDGGIEICRVTEHIYVSDGEGERSYPTLTAVEFVTPGTWSSWSVAGKTWADYSDTDHWADM